MELYKIIADEQEFKRFLVWLPNLEENEKFYCSLFARKKYASELKDAGSDKSQLKRFTATKENLLYKIRQLEIPLGRYLVKGIEVPQHSLVLYINPNPRSMIKANAKMGPHCWSLAKSNGFDLAQEAMSMIQQSCGRKIYRDFDIDSKEIAGTPIDFSTALQDIFPTTDFHSPYTIVESRGGYHLLIDTQLADRMIRHKNGLGGHQWSRNWYSKIVDRFPVDKMDEKDTDEGDRLLPVPGTFQGGHIVKFVDV